MKSIAVITTLCFVVLNLIAATLSAEDRFKILGTAPEVIVFDQATGLQWQQTFVRRTWQGALQYCEGLDYGGHKDWRVPDKNELMSIVDLSRFDPAIDDDAFPGTPSDPSATDDRFWSSSSYVSNPLLVWSAGFGDGSMTLANKEYDEHVRCVRRGP
ncbi:MAG: DUF1566 domain-containing protein [Proteobacteria bacterium]|nr:DUF1566 domain-containing protein [Pseudomonadota bacterium]